MDAYKEKENPSPREGANPLSILFFTYAIGIFKKGYRKVLGVEDMYNPLKCDRSEVLGNRIEKNWTAHLENAKKKNKKPSFLKVLVQTFWPEYLYLAFFKLSMDAGVRIYQAIVLGYLLDYFKPNTHTTREEAFWYAGALAALNAAGAILQNQYNVNGYHYGMKIRAACSTIIYRKALKLNRATVSNAPSGKIVNLLSNDVSRFDTASLCIHPLWVSPTTTIIVAYLLWIDAGWFGLVGILPFALVVPIQSWTANLSSKYRKQTALKTDERVRLMDEIIGGIQVIKMYAWELPCSKLVEICRRKELEIVLKSTYVRGLFMAFNLFTARAALFCSLLTIALIHEPLSSAKVFVFTSYYNIINQTMSNMFVRSYSEVAEVLVSIRRIQDFLLTEEYNNSTLHYNNFNEKDPNAITIKNMTAKCNQEKSKDTLKQINFELEKGKLLGVIGPVGSGKSSLLLTLLGEMDIKKGSININGTISYASQEPWIFAASVRQNILFGEKFDNKKYNKVVKVCALDKDFQQFSNGDMTIVGDRGASLSGGQKARINLARAVYRKADIYLLDDPLSAVDIHVAKHLYKYCINGYLKNKTRVLVTHQVYTLKDADNIAIFKNGCLEAIGNSHVLSKSENEYAKLLVKEPKEENEKIDEKEDSKMIERVKLSRQTSNTSISSTLSKFSIADSTNECKMQKNANNETDLMQIQEDSSKGKVKGPLWLIYLLSGGNTLFVGIVLLLYPLSQIFASGTDYFVSYWTNIEAKRQILNLSELPAAEIEKTELPSTENCLYLYGGILIALFITVFTRSMLFCKLANMSSQKLHDALFNNVVYTTMGFFNAHPSGRILNRFSKDTGLIDEQLPKAFLDAGNYIVMMVGTITMVTIANAYFLIVAVLVFGILGTIRFIFLKSSKNIRRVEGILKGPVFTHLNASIQGLTTIRAYGAQQMLTEEFNKHQDYHTGAWFMYITASSAFSFYLESLCFIFTTVVTFSFLFLNDDAPGGKVGLAITQATALTGIVQFGLKQSAETANQLMAVERVMQYNTIPKEKQPEIPKIPPHEWPHHGKLTFKHMSMKYEDGTQALNDLNIVIQSKEKVGIVGRTGAGKSSLISSLFRLAFVEGKIEIDGIDTKDLQLQYLRSKISIIPQDPVLFSGTLRYNLDPFQQYPDEMLWNAINKVNLKDPPNMMNLMNLDSLVLDKGSNYSVGQRQLICLARALLRNNKILLLDEATANIDPHTDELIQKTIRQIFANCTVLTVAHSLNTIIDSDRVIVMEAGSIVETNHPHVLLQDSNSKFYHMVSRTDKTTFEQLKNIAKNAYETKFANTKN